MAERSLNVYTRHACKFHRWILHKQSPKQSRWKIKWKREREEGDEKKRKKKKRSGGLQTSFSTARDFRYVPFYKQSSKHPRGKIPPPYSKLNLLTSFSVDLFVNSCHAPPIQIKKLTENSTILTGQRVSWIEIVWEFHDDFGLFWSGLDEVRNFRFYGNVTGKE